MDLGRQLQSRSAAKTRGLETPCRDVEWKEKTLPNSSSGKAVLSRSPRTLPESPQSSGAPACAHSAIAIPGGRGGESRKYGLAIGRIWEGFFFHLTYREGGAQVQILGDLSRGSARGAKRPTFDLRPKFRRRGIRFRRGIFVLHMNGTALRDLVIWGGGPRFFESGRYW